MAVPSRPGAPAARPAVKPAAVAAAKPATRPVQARPTGIPQGFVYRPRSAATLASRANQTGGNYDSIFVPGINTYKPKEGRNYVRVLPPTWDLDLPPEEGGWGDHWAITIWIHRNVGPNNDTYLCPLKLKGEHCPICAAREEALLNGDEEFAKAVKLGKQSLVWIIDRSDEQGGPKAWTMPWTVEREFADRCRNKKTDEIIQIDNPNEGFDIEFRRDGTDEHTKYGGEDINRSASPILDDPAQQAKVIKYIMQKPLPDILNIYGEEYLQKVVTGSSAPPDEAAEEAQPKPVSRRPVLQEPVEETAEEEQVEEIPEEGAEEVPWDEETGEVAEELVEEDVVTETLEEMAEEEAVEEDQPIEEEVVEEEPEPAPLPRRPAAAVRPTSPARPAAAPARPPTGVRPAAPAQTARPKPQLNPPVKPAAKPAAKPAQSAAQTQLAKLRTGAK